MIVRLVALLLVMTAAAPASAAKREPCPDARYVVAGEPIVPGGPTPDVIATGPTVSLASGCAPTKLRRKTKKKGTILKAVWKSGCSGVTGKVKLTGKIDPSCTNVAGKVRGKKAKLIRTFTATRSTCGDGVWDAGAEACEATSGCAANQHCTAGCLCEDDVIVDPGNRPPVAAATGPVTTTVGTPVVYDGSGSSDPDGDTLTHAWDFGDGGRAGGSGIAHVFASAGSFTVRLTVADGRGGIATDDVAVAVSPSTVQPGPEVSASGLVRTVSGAPIADAAVSIEPGGTSGTTDAQGRVIIGMRTGVPSQVRVRKSGFTDQVVVVAAVDGADAADFEVTMLAREAALSLDAGAGGTLAGKHGARVVLPANALVKDDGTAVTGAVDVSISPLDVTEEPSAFPGRCEGLRTDSSQGLLVTHGTVEYALEQNGAPVNLKPGSTAVIEIPVYAALEKNGTPIALGDTAPLWSLDERTGGWVEEGVGTVVQSASSPSGLALRGTVTHFSWWNHDQFESPPARPKPRCKVDSNADGILEDLTGTGYCWHAGTGPEQPDDGFLTAAATTPRLPQYTAQTMLPPNGGVELPIPADMDIVFRSHALGGTLRGTKVVRLGPNVPTDVDIVLHPVDGAVTPIDPLPHDGEYEVDEPRAFSFQGTAGQQVWVSLDPIDGPPWLRADAMLVGPGEAQLQSTNFGGSDDALGGLGIELPSTGTYRIDLVASVAGAFRLQVTVGSGPFPFVLDTTPAPNATGVAVDAEVGVSFTPNGTSPAHFVVSGPDYEAVFDAPLVSNAASDTPATPFQPGTTYLVSQSDVSDSVTGREQAPNPMEWTFTTAEEVGAAVPVFEAGALDSFRDFAIAIGPGGVGHPLWSTFFTAGSGGGQVFGAGYESGVGWDRTQEVSARITGTAPGVDVTVDADGVATAVWDQREVLTSPFRHGIYASRREPGADWSAPQLIEDSTISFESFGEYVGADADGNVIAVWNHESPLTRQVWWNRFTAGAGWGTAAVLADGTLPSDLNDPSDYLVVAADGSALVAYEDGDEHMEVRRYTPGDGWGAATDFGEGTIRIATNASGGGMVFIQSGSTTFATYRLMLDPAPAWCASPPWCVLPALDPDGIFASTLALAPDGSAIMVVMEGGVGITAQHYTPHATEEDAGTWTSAGTLISPIESPVQLQLGMDAAGNAVAVWRKSDLSIGLRLVRYTAGGTWSAVQFFPDITGSSTTRLAVGPDGDAVVLSAFGKLLRGMRLP